MPRWISTVLVVALLGGTAAAFAVTQGLKAQPSPIAAKSVSKVFSPVCDCTTRVATIRFRLRKPDRVRLQIVTTGGAVVRTLVPGKRLRRGTVTYTWNGRNDLGDFVPQGIYQPRVHLADQHRTIDLPNDMRVDTTPPVVTLVSAKPTKLSPDGDHRSDDVAVAYRTNEPAHAILLVDGTRVVYTRKQLEQSSLSWNGLLQGKPAAPGRYRLQLEGQDRAGNVSGPTPVVDVVVRYVTLSKSRYEARARKRFGVRVDADARFGWKLGPRSGTGLPGLLVLHAPKRPGRYTLTVTVGRHSAHAAVIVSKA